jgi:hypothetical protein
LFGGGATRRIRDRSPQGAFLRSVRAPINKNPHSLWINATRGKARVAMLTWQNHWQAVKDYYLIVLKGP